MTSYDAVVLFPCNYFDTFQIYQSALGLMMPALFYGAHWLQNSESFLKAAIAEVVRDKVAIAKI